MKPFIKLYLYKEPFEYIKLPILPAREEYVQTVNPPEKDDSIAIWDLLGTILLKDFDVLINSLNPRKLETGRWVFDKYYISMSHSRGYYAIAISSDPIGVDIQKDVESLSSPHRWSEEEYKYFENKMVDIFVATWTRKEALYKFLDPGIPYKGNEKNFNTIPYNEYFRTWFCNDRKFMGASICSDLIANNKDYDFVLDTNLDNKVIKEVTKKDFSRRPLLEYIEMSK